MSRPQRAANPSHIRFAEFELDEANASLRRHGKAVALAPTPFDLLCALARQPGTLLTKDTLLDEVWGHQHVTESVLKTAVSDLRTVLGDSPREPRFIETVARRGYRFIAATVAAAAQPPAGAQPEPRRAPSFIGRADAVARLQRAWGQARNGQRVVVWVAGEPGIGKTTVIEHFVAGLGDAACARGQCVEHYGPGEPYLPVLEALAELCRKDAALPALLRSVAPTWLLQLPWLGGAEERDALRRELAGVGADRMLREMGELLDRYTEQRPLLLVTEDLHWSDRATIQLIDHVARRRGSARLMWLASFRVAEVVALEHPLNPLRRELRLHRLCDEVVLDSLSESEVAAYVAQRSAPLAHDEAFVRTLHERTDGVPLFVSSLLADVLEQADDGAAIDRRLAVAVPENLAAIIDHYIARLTDGQRELLAAAAVCGVDFRVDTLALALGRELGATALACDELVRGHVWLSAPRAEGGDAAPAAPYSFRHALFRQVAYQRIPPSLRIQLHAAVGAALARERAAGAGIPAAELALHYDRGRQPLAALRCYAEAAQAALLNFSPTTCIGLAERALTLLRQAPDDAERDALEITLATLQGMAAFHVHGVGNQARDSFGRAHALLARAPGHPLGGRLLHGFGYLLSLRGEYPQALEVAQQAEALAAGSDDGVLMLAACFLQAHTRHLQGQWHEARSWTQRGLAIARTLDSRAKEGFAADPEVTMLGLQAIDLVRSGSIPQCRDHVRRAQARAAGLSQPISRLVAAWHEALVEVRLGNVDRLETLSGEMQALVDEFALEQGRTASLWFRGWVEARRGRAREGHRLIREAYERNVRLGMHAGSSEVLGYAAEALLLAGDGAAAHAQLQEALQIAHGLNEGVYLPQLLLLEAAVAHAQGRSGDGAASARRAVAESRAQEAPWFELLALVDLCEHQLATAAERQSLGALVDRMPEAAGMEPVRRALAVLRHA
jgi:DNA-binding winged helix-turn-helix (wHTH) protein/tetratricopeptide (TPR) repeat protein